MGIFNGKSNKEIPQNKLEDSKIESKSENEVELKLSLESIEDSIASELQKEYLKEDLEKLPPIKKGELNVSTDYIYDDGTSIEAKVFIRNGFESPINLEYLPLVIRNKNGSIILEQVFDLRDTEEIPPFSARPIKITFEKQDISIEKISHEQYEVCFSGKLNQIQYADIELDEIPNNLSEEEIRLITSFVNKEHRVEVGKVNITTFSIALQKNGQLLISLMISNGADQKVEINKIPITVSDKSGRILASGVFEMNNLVVGSKKARIQNVAFDTGLKVENDIDMNDLIISFNA